ncbi:MAG: hypothetical protein J7L66_06080 [Anaerolineaceae bacterium]|nr:hypothetical protein [Anaerolineaceae bacterium]
MDKHITIDFSKIYEIARKGINRSAVFMGLGVSAADQELLDYHLTKDTNFSILPDKVSEGTLRGWKKEFRIWVVGCGFREMVDRLCVFLDKTHLVLRIIDKTNTDKIINDFEYLGLRKKIDYLRTSLDLSFNFSEQLASFTETRNCFVHRLGRVGKIDLKYTNPLTLRFMRFDCVFTTEDGKETKTPDLLDPVSPPFHTPEAGKLGLKWTEKKLEFKKNEWINLSPKDLTEILYFALRCASDIHNTSIGFAKSRGIPIVDQSKKEMATYEGLSSTDK